MKILGFVNSGLVLASDELVIHIWYRQIFIILLNRSICNMKSVKHVQLVGFFLFLIFQILRWCRLQCNHTGDLWTNFFAQKDLSKDRYRSLWEGFRVLAKKSLVSEHNVTFYCCLNEDILPVPEKLSKEVGTSLFVNLEKKSLGQVVGLR